MGYRKFFCLLELYRPYISAKYLDPSPNRVSQAAN